jgi:hypothetical protein
MFNARIVENETFFAVLFAHDLGEQTPAAMPVF